MPDRPLTILQLTHQGGPAGSTQSIFGLSQHLARQPQAVDYHVFQGNERIELEQNGSYHRKGC